MPEEKADSTYHAFQVRVDMKLWNAFSQMCIDNCAKPAALKYPYRGLLVIGWSAIVPSKPPSGYAPPDGRITTSYLHRAANSHPTQVRRGAILPSRKR